MAKCKQRDLEREEKKFQKLVRVREKRSKRLARLSIRIESNFLHTLYLLEQNEQKIRTKKTAKLAQRSLTIRKFGTLLRLNCSLAMITAVLVAWKERFAYRLWVKALSVKRIYVLRHRTAAVHQARVSDENIRPECWERLRSCAIECAGCVRCKQIVSA